MKVKVINNESFPDLLEVGSIYEVTSENDKMFTIFDEVHGIFGMHKTDFEIVEE